MGSLESLPGAVNWHGWWGRGVKWVHKCALHGLSVVPCLTALRRARHTGSTSWTSQRRCGAGQEGMSTRLHLVSACMDGRPIKASIMPLAHFPCILLVASHEIVDTLVGAADRHTSGPSKPRVSKDRRTPNPISPNSCLSHEHVSCKVGHREEMPGRSTPAHSPARDGP